MDLRFGYLHPHLYPYGSCTLITRALNWIYFLDIYLYGSNKLIIIKSPKVDSGSLGKALKPCEDRSRARGRGRPSPWPRIRWRDGGGLGVSLGAQYGLLNQGIYRYRYEYF